MKPLSQVFEKFNLSFEQIIHFGRYVAKLDTENFSYSKNSTKGHLILVTAMNPTPQGEGKTTTTIGLGDALNLLKKKTLICLRQPSMGPGFGVKGGATGGGRAQLTPMETINLNFTGDLHAIGAAHNLLSAMIDNHIHWGNELKIDLRKIKWRRVMDMNDRALRSITQSLGGSANGFPREDGFDITVASEVMAIFCLSKNLQDLQEKLGKIVIGVSSENKPITASDLKAHGAMAAILKTALMPNMVQTLEGNPALVHGGPFANIAHGCNSIIATQTALSISDYVVTEAGFGADLGAEKFLNIKCRQANIWPSCAVLVATVRGIRHQGSKSQTDPQKSLETGISNIRRHIENLKKFKIQTIVALNRFSDDSEEDLKWIIDYCAQQLHVKCVINNSWAQGSLGSKDLAESVVEVCENLNQQNHNSIQGSFLYKLDLPLFDKIKTIAQEIYRAKEVFADESVLKNLEQYKQMGFDHLPVCIAKTQYSFSTDPKKLGAAEDHIFKVREVRLAAGAGFIVAICGDIMTMPGLPKKPAAESIFINSKNEISGLF